MDLPVRRHIPGTKASHLRGALTKETTGTAAHDFPPLSPPPSFLYMFLGGNLLEPLSPLFFSEPRTATHCHTTSHDNSDQKGSLLIIEAEIGSC
jgi:hypothetical protein